MTYEIFMIACPVLMLSKVTKTDYQLTSKKEDAMTFDTEAEALDVRRFIPGTDVDFWGVRPHRPK